MLEAGLERRMSRCGGTEAERHAGDGDSEHFEAL